MITTAQDGKSALHIACKFDRVECAEILLKCGAVASAKDHVRAMRSELHKRRKKLSAPVGKENHLRAERAPGNGGRGRCFTSVVVTVIVAHSS